MDCEPSCKARFSITRLRVLSLTLTERCPHFLFHQSRGSLFPDAEQPVTSSQSPPRTYECRRAHLSCHVDTTETLWSSHIQRQLKRSLSRFLHKILDDLHDVQDKDGTSVLIRKELCFLARLYILDLHYRQSLTSIQSSSIPSP